MTHTRDAGQGRPSKIRITVIIQDRYTLDAGMVTSHQIRKMANIPSGFSLHRRAKGGNESIRDDESVEVRNGDHFFARPSRQSGLAHDEES